jgi:hypothetical protein
MKLQIKNLGMIPLFKLAALILTVSTFFKSIIDVGRKDFDSWWYHLPFAARIWQIVPEDSYGFEDNMESQFQGFPLLAEFLQGGFWFTFYGQYKIPTNPSCLFNFMLYIFQNYLPKISRN